MIHLVTAATADYPWAAAYWESVRKYFPVNKEESPDVALRRYWLVPDATSLLNASGSRGIEPYPTEKFLVQMPQNRAKCMQHGEFLKYIIPRSGRDVVIFTDADMIMQRGFTELELETFRTLGPDEILMGYNRGSVNGGKQDTLLEEAELLSAHRGHNLDWALFDKLLPGWQELPVWNTGVTVARVETWRRLYDLARVVLPVCEAMFNHYAALQFAISYCAGKYLRPGLLSQEIHVHGHFGLPPGCEWAPDGDVIVETQGEIMDFKKAVFRHCLNLTPAKGPSPEKVSQ